MKRPDQSTISCRGRTSALQQCFHAQWRCARQTSARAFTLIELLVVIAIIGVLAGLIIGVGPGAYNKKVLSRVQTELAGLVTVIEHYNEKVGNYPPDNTNNPAQPPLFYELTGTISKDDGDPITYRTINGQESILTSDVKRFFGIDGFSNSDADSENVKNFYPNLKPSQFKEISTAPDVEVLVVPYKGPTGNLNPWRYNSSNPVHNPGSYDLWAEIVMGSKTNIIGNWKD